MDLSEVQRDSTAVSAGQWVDEIPNCGDLRLLVRGLSSPYVVAVRSRLERRVPKSDRERDNTLKTTVALKIFGEVLHEAVLLGWENFTKSVPIGEGEEGYIPPGEVGHPALRKVAIPYNKEDAMTFCTHPDYGPFADAVSWAAMFVDRSSKDMQDELEKNSLNGSSGKSNGASAPKQ